jgi:hypothetical protein
VRQPQSVVYLGNQWRISEPPASCNLLLHCAEVRRLHNAVKEEKEKGSIPRYSSPSPRPHFLAHAKPAMQPGTASSPTNSSSANFDCGSR